MNKRIVGLFSSYEDANGAVTELMNMGYKKEDFDLAAKEGVLAASKSEKNVENNLGMGTVSGARAGAMVGGIAGLIVGISALALPGIGPFITIGTLSSAIGSTAVGAGLGAASGGIVGGLLGLGLTTEEAVEFEKGVTAGEILLAVSSKGDDQAVKYIFKNHNAVRVN